MSDIVITSGGSNPYKAIVDDHGRIQCLSIQVSHMAHHSSYHHNAYMKVYSTTLASTNEDAVALLYNSSEGKDLELYSITISSDSDVDISVKVGESYISGGTSVDVVNTNTSSSVLPSVVSYEGGAGNLVLDTTNSKELDGQFAGARRPIVLDYSGAIILSPKKGVAFYAQGAIGDKVKVTIEFALHTEGTKL